MSKGQFVRLLCTTLLLSACASQSVNPPSQSEDTEPQLPTLPPSAWSLTADSTIWVAVFRDGPMARLGHNHVVRVPLQGRVDPSSGRFVLSSMLATWEVDRAEDRAAANQHWPGEFSQQPNQGDINGTKKNMLSPSLLNGGIHPQLNVSGQIDVQAAKNGTRQLVPLTIWLAGKSHRLALPIKVEEQQVGRAVFTGEHSIHHSALGLQPFSVMGGAISVKEQIELRYRVVVTAP